VELTVAICTWNRAALLTKTLENMLNLKSDSSFSWELLIVNNNCTDGTDTVIQSFVDRLPIKRIFEPKPGLSNARNAAVRNAGGDYIIWTDDDVLVDSNWLLAYVEAFHKYPDAVVFGGPVVPWFEGVPPEWITLCWSVVSIAYAVRDLGEQEITLDPQTGKIPFGANFAIRAREQQKYLYDPNFGLKAGEIVLGEETHIIKSIIDAGGAGFWVPSAKVKHWLPKERQTIEYIKKYSKGVGRTHARIQKNSVRPFLFGVPRWFIALFIKRSFLFLTMSLFGSTEKKMASMIAFYRSIGGLSEYMSSR